MLVQSPVSMAVVKPMFGSASAASCDCRRSPAAQLCDCSARGGLPHCGRIKERSDLSPFRGGEASGSPAPNSES